MAQVPFTPTSTSTSTSNAINSFGNTVSTAKGIGAIGEQNISIFGHGPLHPMGQEPLQINPPNLEDYSSEEDENSNEEDEEEEEKEKTKPLTRDELKIRTLKGLRKTSTKTSPNKKKSQYAVQLKYEK
jgi:hypothetical protein